MRDTKTKMRTCGFTFLREPAWIDRTVSHHWTVCQHNSKKNTALSITLKRYSRFIECTLSIGAIRDNARLQRCELQVRGSTYRGALVDALDIAKTPLALFGFKGAANV